MTCLIHEGDCREVMAGMPEQRFHCCATSPPYFGLRSYNGGEREIGLEPTPDEFVEAMRSVFGGEDNPVGVWRVLRDDGVLWLNLGDSYARTGGWASNDGLDGCKRGESGRAKSNMQRGINGQKSPAGFKEKDLLGIPWRVAFALQADGWYLRDAIIWHKPSPMPGSQQDRCTSSYEFIFQLTKKPRYYYDMTAVVEPSSVSSGAANGTPLSCSTVGKELVATLNTNDKSFKAFGGSVPIDSKGTVISSMTFEAENIQIGEVIRFFVTIEKPEGSYVVDLEATVGPNTTVDAFMPISIQDLFSDSDPSRPPVVKMTASPSCAILASLPGRSPLPPAGPATEIVRPELALVAAEGLSAEITFHRDELRATLSIQTAFPTHVRCPSPNSITPTRTPRNVWKIAHEGFRDAHFATFPRELPTRCIKASTSEKGCCPACGAGWERIVDRDRKPTRPGNNNVSDDTGKANRDEQRHVTETRTVGWEPGCKCPGLDGDHPGSDCADQDNWPTVPCRVLDIFSGAGTTGVAACTMGRDYDGIELNPGYAQMSRDRIAREMNPATARADKTDNSPLFTPTGG